MSTSMLETPTRTHVESLVRSILSKHLERESREARNGHPAGAARPNVVVHISARHCHLTQADLEVLFGTGYALTPMRTLYQTTDFAANETVAVVGPRLGGRRRLSTCGLHIDPRLCLGWIEPACGADLEDEELAGS